MMKATPRRRARLRSSQYAIERWKPSPVVAVVLAGLILGFGLGFVGRTFDQSASLQEHYLLLVSDLYAKGMPVDGIRARLLHLGYSNPSVAIVGVADQLALSSEPVKKQEANQLHQFAEALAASSVADANPTITVRATTTPASDSTPTVAAPFAAVAPFDLVPSTPVALPTDVATAAPVSAPPVPAAAPPAPATAPVMTPTVGGNGKTGVVKTSDRTPVFYRKDPSSKAAKIGVLPYGTTVTILGVVQGEAIDAGNKSWYHISVNGHDGYIYAKYVQVGG